jgi:hypothetical protein
MCLPVPFIFVELLHIFATQSDGEGMLNLSGIELTVLCPS